MAFAHLHTHTAYSLLDGEGTIPKILDRAKELGQTAMAITDHGNMYGVIEFYEYARQIGIKPVLGCEVYVAPRTRFDKTHEYDAQSSHLILLAENDTGYKNLMFLVSAGFTEGFYYKPRIDMALLREHSEGLIALSACMFGVLSRQILDNNYAEAKRRAEEFLSIFGREHYFIELQDHGLPVQQRLNRELVALARELDIAVVATNDIHYVRQEDAVYQDVLMCIQMGKTVEDEDRMKMESAQLYVKSEEEMRALFSYIPEAIENSQRIADRCQVEIEFGKLHLPAYQTPGGQDAFAYLQQLCTEGLARRYPHCTEEIRERMRYELQTIRTMGYVDYFLIVWDFIHYARAHEIMVGPGRGSAAGSVVAYCLEITDVDPIKYGLIFERFLNPERISMPDIDIDFCYERRQEVIDYVTRKYGEDHVCQIITFGTMAAKQAIRDVGRALNFPYGTVDAVAKQIPFALHITIDKAMTVNAELKRMYDTDPQIKKLIDTAKELEGLPRHASTHAAGVVITKEPLCNYVPLQMNDDVLTTQFTMTTIERLGLLKMDFLGLRTLTVIRDAVAHIRESKQTEVVIGEIDMADSATYAMIAAGETDGVFQLESGGMKQFMKELKPSNLEDIIAGISLYRPGPMDSIPTYIANKNDVSHIRYKHPLLEHILDVTYGCIIYQEQVMQIVRELGGYSLGRADLVRRAMSKKKADVMEKERQTFIYGMDDGETHIDGAVKRGVDEKTAAAIFDEMMDFASYAFNKSHAAAYAVVAYQTAWLKCHYPVEFFAALLTSFIDSLSRVAKYIQIAKKSGIRVLPPDINKSGRSFTVDGNAVRFGLGAVKNVGGAVVDEIVQERTADGPFRSFTDFCGRMAGRRINKRVVESLIQCGAFDGLGCKRAVLMEVYERVLEDSTAQKKSIMPGQLDLFGSLTALEKTSDDSFPDRPEFSEKEKLAMEKECLGIYVSGHPLEAYRALVQQVSTASLAEIRENENHRFSEQTQVRVAGVLTRLRTQTTKKGDLMMYAQLEDLTGDIELLLFPRQLQRFRPYLQTDGMVIVSGSLDVTEEAPDRLIVDEVRPLTEAKDGAAAKKLYLKLYETDLAAQSEVKRILEGGGGDIPVFLHFADTHRTLRAPSRMQVREGDGKMEKLVTLLGEEQVKLVSK